MKDRELVERFEAYPLMRKTDGGIDGARRAYYGIREFWPDVSIDFRGMKILNLGCGSIYTSYSSPWKEDIAWHPWFARGLTILGAEVTGVDKLCSPGEKYEHIVMDLTRESLVDRLGDRRFDVVTTSDFFDAPDLKVKHAEIFEKIGREAYELLIDGGRYCISPGWESDHEILEKIGFKLEEAPEYIIFARKVKQT